MKDLLPQISKWIKEKKPFAMARVIQTWGSSPRPVGSALIVSSDGEMAGSVSGGCIEGFVIKESKSVLLNGAGKILDYGISDDDAWSAGLACGGKVQVYLQSYPSAPQEQEVWIKLLELLSSNKSFVWITTLVNGNQNDSLLVDGKVAGVHLPAEVIKQAADALIKRSHASVDVNQERYFIQVFPRRSQLLIIGAAHITADLVQLAKSFDFETIVIDPRGTFANSTQFEVAPDQILDAYPSEVLDKFTLDGNTYAVVLSHDPKIDDDALQILLGSDVAYIGALGSRKNHEKRIGRLREAGFSDQDISRIEAPIGVDIHAQGAREIALSIMGSVIRAKNT